MKRRDLADLVLLAALWGGSFLFMRMGAVEFGPVALVFLRVTGAALMLLPLLAARGQLGALRQHARTIGAVGIINSALPFLLFAMAALALTTALMSVFNATASIWGALVAWLWLGERLDRWRWLGLAIGVAGVVGLSWGQADFKPGAHGVSAAVGIAGCLLASVLYGFAGNLSRKHLAGVPSLAVAAGSQLAASLALALPAWWWWPAVTPGAQAWLAAFALALACTGLAYVLYFRLIANVGAAQAMSVTFLIPAFALLWGWLLLGERPTGSMLTGCAVILVGTALATGLWKPRLGRAAKSASP
jgi:drug/metabolite transporter (DMT)-like permease